MEMIPEFTKAWAEKQDQFRALFATHPRGYDDLVKRVVSVLSDGEHGSMDPERVHCIDDGEYQGTMIFVIGAVGYQPSDYWCTRVGYGSCSGCDALESVRDYGDYGDPPNEKQVAKYMQLALHIVQRMRVLP